MDGATPDDYSSEGTTLRFLNLEGFPEPPDLPGIGTQATLSATYTW